MPPKSALAAALPGEQGTRKLHFQYVRHGAPETLLAFLSRRFAYHSASVWQERVDAGAVTVDGEAVAAQRVLESGQRVIYVPPLGLEPAVDARYRVLYDDEHLLAVEKSGNIPTSPSGKYWYHCLRNLLLRDYGLPMLYPVHRLDRETSGVNLFAKTPQAARVLGWDFAAGRMEKSYAAVLRGALPGAEVFVSAPLRVGLGPIRVKQSVHPQGKAARTIFRLLQPLPGASLVQVLPQTGRTHQIRAHAAYLGHPVWGDRLYGMPEAEFLATLHVPPEARPRHLLHAERLALSHPISGERLELVAPHSLLELGGFSAP